MSVILALTVVWAVCGFGVIYGQIEKKRRAEIAFVRVIVDVA